MLFLQFIFLSNFLIYCACQVTNYEYSIQVPKFPCASNNTVVTSIRITGNDAQKLSYEWKVNFKTNSTCLKQQRCTLLIWKSVREVERAFINKTVDIGIQNALLMPTVQYVLNVTVRANNTLVDNKQFILECTNSTIGNQPIPEKLNNDPYVNLLGSNVTYRDMTYILNAEAVNCVENNSFHYKWEILDESENLVKSEFIKGSVLRINSKILTAAKQYFIRCSLIDSQNASVIAMTTQNLQVLSRGMILIFTVRKLSVGLNKTFKLSAYFQDADNQNDEIKINWTCADENNAPCNNFKTSNSTILEGLTITKKGRYNFTITIIKNDVKISDFCEVNGVPNAYVGIEVDDIDVPLDPSKEIIVPAYVTSLMSGCSLQWTSINLKQHGYIDFSRVPGKIDSKTNITLMEDEFLNEIDEYTNNTVDKEYNLIIPKPDGKWSGVKGNASYIFRINVTCPDIQDLDRPSEESIEELENIRKVTLTADVLIYTDMPPIMNSLHVNPLNGVALKTQFSFYTNSNEDSSMLYKFGYVLKNHSVFVGNTLGVGICKSVLPYLGNGVKTVLEGCNAHNLCTEIVGPSVSITKPLLSDDDKTYLITELTELMRREEYEKVFTQAVAILQTYENIKDIKALRSFEDFVISLTISEIEKLLKANKDEDGWIILANNLIKDVGIMLSTISVSEELLNNIILLRNKISNKKDVSGLVEQVETPYNLRKLLSVDRIKRETERMTLEEVKSYLVISELIITTSTDKNRVQQEKQHLMNQVDKFMVQLCNTLHLKQQTMNLDLKTVSISLEKLNKNNANRYFHILHDTNSWKINGRIKLGKCFIENLVFTNQLCLGKALFKNYLKKEDFVYMIKVYGTKSNDQLKIQDMFCDAILVLPVDQDLAFKKDPQCSLWRGRWEPSQCKTLQVASRTIQCQCRYLGYYSLDYIDIATTTVSSVSVTTKLSTTIKTNPTALLTTVTTVPTTINISTSTSTLTISTENTEKPKTEITEVPTTVNILTIPTTKTTSDYNKHLTEVPTTVNTTNSTELHTNDNTTSSNNTNQAF